MRGGLLLVAAVLAGACESSTTPPAVVRIEPATATAFTGAVGTEVTPAPTVRAVDEDGRPLAGVDISFQVASGGGAIANTAVKTGGNGLASAGTWILGPEFGLQQVRAESGTAQVIFSAHAYGYGSVTGIVRGLAGTGWPWGTWPDGGIPGSVWPLLGIFAVPEAPGQARRRAREEGRTGSFRFDSLPSGQWTIRFDGMHPFPGVFPTLRLYADTAITVTVEPDRTVDVSDVVVRPVDPFILVAIDHCPWGFSSPPTLDDWGTCDSGYWNAPVDVRVDFVGVVGTPTSGRRYSFSIPAWQMYFELHDAVPGDYVVTVAPAAGPVAWRLVPWQSSSTRLQLDRGMAYALFSFWYQVGSQ